MKSMIRLRICITTASNSKETRWRKDRKLFRLSKLGKVKGHKERKRIHIRVIESEWKRLEGRTGDKKENVERRLDWNRSAVKMNHRASVRMFCPSKKVRKNGDRWRECRKERAWNWKDLSNLQGNKEGSERREIASNRKNFGAWRKRGDEGEKEWQKGMNACFAGWTAGPLVFERQMRLEKQLVKFENGHKVIKKRERQGNSWKKAGWWKIGLERVASFALPRQKCS